MSAIPAIELGLDILKQLAKLYEARKANPGLERIGAVMADVDALVAIYEKRVIEKEPYTDAEKRALLDYIGAAEEPPKTRGEDPTSIEYETLDEAIKHTEPSYPLVIKKDNGKFVVWPNLGPFPGEQAYPAF